MIQLAFSRVRRSLLAAIVTASAATIAAAVEPCRIEVVDHENGWPVPLVELRTTHDVALVTDNAGVIAIDQPELMDREMWFHVSGHGYSVPKDGFGYSGVRLTPQPGATLRVEVDRTIVAKRLGRLTGAGLFAESQKLGGDADWQESGVFGCDSVQMTVHRDRCFWLWGDTDLARYPLGVFNASSATTELQPIASLEPPLRVKYDYFIDDAGVPRGVANIPGEGPTWLSGYVSIPDRHGEPRLVATYSKIRGYLEAYEIGLCVWNEERQKFDRLRILWTKTDAQPDMPTVFPDGHVTIWRDDAGRRVAVVRQSVAHDALPGDVRGVARCQPVGAARKADASRSRRPTASASNPAPARSPGTPSASAGSRSSCRRSASPRASASCGTPRPDAHRPVGPGREGAVARQLHVLQPAAAPGVYGPRFARAAVRRHVHDDVRRQAGPHAAVRLQPDSLPAGPRRPGAGAGARVGCWAGGGSIAVVRRGV